MNRHDNLAHEAAILLTVASAKRRWRLETQQLPKPGGITRRKP